MKMTSLEIRQAVVAMFILVVILAAPIVPAAAAEMKAFTLVNVLIDQTKVWLPSTIVVYEGDEVELTLDNKLTAPHGFKLAAYDIEVVVPPQEKRTVHFTATKKGAYSFVCQIHPPHVGGQIVVLDK